ncbi:MAG: GHKL domain-containing protein [Clostridiales bacterium]|nr:GHKL domain-containing protein [Clostridiales bacterium]
MNIAWSEIFDFDGLVEIVVMLVTVMSIFEWRYGRRRTILTAVGCGAAFFLCNTAVIVGNEAFDLVSDTVRFNLYAVLIVSFGFLFAVRCLKGYWQQHLVTILFFKDCVLFVSFLYKTTEDTWPDLLGDSPFAWLVGKVISIVMILLAALLCKTMSHPIHTPISAGYWCISALTPVLLLLLWEQMDGANPNGNGDFAMNAAVNAMLLAVSFSAYALFVRLAREMEKQMELQLTNQSLAFQIRQVDDAQAQLEQTRTARHEMKNTYFYLESLLEQGKYDEMRQVLERDIWPQFERQELVATGNQLVDMILSQKVADARRRDIPVVLDVQLPRELKVQQQMLCSLLSNLLDNAIEASCQVELPDIFCSMREQKGYLRVEVRNRIDCSVLSQNPTLRTTKQDRKNHGIGMRIIRQVVDRSDGVLDIRERDGYFVVQALLPEREETEPVGMRQSA